MVLRSMPGTFSFLLVIIAVTIVLLVVANANGSLAPVGRAFASLIFGNYSVPIAIGI